MRKITVLDFCSRIGIASDEIPVVVKAGINIVGRYRSLYIKPSVFLVWRMGADKHGGERHPGQ